MAQDNSRITPGGGGVLNLDLDLEQLSIDQVESLDSTVLRNAVENVRGKINDPTGQQHQQHSSHDSTFSKGFF